MCGIADVLPLAVYSGSCRPPPRNELYTSCGAAVSRTHILCIGLVGMSRRTAWSLSHARHRIAEGRSRSQCPALYGLRLSFAPLSGLCERPPSSSACPDLLLPRSTGGACHTSQCLKTPWCLPQAAKVNFENLLPPGFARVTSCSAEREGAQWMQHLLCAKITRVCPLETNHVHLPLE